MIFTDYTHEPAITYASRLLSHLPKGFSRVFYTDNGSTAVEAALKMAIQYWENQGRAKKKIVVLKGGYHGDTFGAMSCGGKTLFTLPFLPYLFETISVSNEEEMEKAMHKRDVVCFLYEPILQGAWGMRLVSSDLLNALLRIARHHEALLIADEVLTGFGRCGPLFASSLLDTQPDLMALAKGITGGFLPLGATCCREEIFSSFEGHPFYHGHSYSGNPLGCAAALASLDLLEQPGCAHKRLRIEHSHKRFVEKWKGGAPLSRLETLGTLLALEYHSPPPLEFFHRHHLLMRPLGNVYYVLPPYCITEEELETIYTTLELSWS